MASSASAAAFLADGFGDASLRAGEADGGRDLVGVFARVREGDEGVSAGCNIQPCGIFPQQFKGLLVL